MNTAVRHTILLACCLFGASATLAAEPTTPFKCEGLFGRDTSHAKLVAAFGAANAITNFDEETDADVTVVFPDDSKRRLKINWKDQKRRKDLGGVTIVGPSSWSVAGITMGMPLVEVERLNGRPFQLNDFQGDYSGAITDWLGGRLSIPLPGGCHVGAFVWIDDRIVSDALAKEVTPDGSRFSSGVALRAAKPVVNQLSVGFWK